MNVKSESKFIINKLVILPWSCIYWDLIAYYINKHTLRSTKLKDNNNHKLNE